MQFGFFAILSAFVIKTLCVLLHCPRMLGGNYRGCPSCILSRVLESKGGLCPIGGDQNYQVHCSIIEKSRLVPICILFYLFLGSLPMEGFYN